MKNMQKTRNSIALAVALASTAMLASTQTFAAPQNPANGNGFLTDNSVPYVAQNGLGQVLIAPYYTVRDNQRTAINIMNTSSETLAVKVVIREGRRSRDVLNFYILMSPYDAWTGFLSNSTGTPVLHRSTDEDTCVVGAFGRTVNNVFTPMASMIEPLSDDGLVSGVSADTLNEGYITFIAAGKVNTSARAQDPNNAQVTIPVGANYAAAIKHNNATGMPANCGAALAPFTADPGSPSDLNVAGLNAVSGTLNTLFSPLGLDETPLKGNLSILNRDEGIAGGTQMTAIARFNQSGDSLVTPQAPPYFNEPSLASSEGLCDASGLTDIEDALRANSMFNEWAFNPATSAKTDAVVTFPTKGFRTDASTSDANALGFVGCRTLPATNAVYDGNGATAGLPIFYSLFGYDREEREPINAPIPSPATYSRPAFENEVNVISFMPDGMVGPLASSLASNVDLASAISGTPNGWFELQFTNSGLAAKGTPLDDPKVSDLAALGFVFKVRQQPGSADTNFGQIIDHSSAALSK